MSSEIERLISLRQRFNLPRSYIAFRLKVHPDTIFRWEKQGQMPSPGHRLALNDYLVRFRNERVRSGGLNV